MLGSNFIEGLFEFQLSALVFSYSYCQATIQSVDTKIYPHHQNLCTIITYVNNNFEYIIILIITLYNCPPSKFCGLTYIPNEQWLNLSTLTIGLLNCISCSYHLISFLPINEGYITLLTSIFTLMCVFRNNSHGWRIEIHKLSIPCFSIYLHITSIYYIINHKSL